MTRHKLAIIIPAYKAEYLAITLASLYKQTDTRFKVYIGDDCSPYDLKTIVDQFIDKLEIVYHRFENNLGSISLTKQWERCVLLSNEEWIWLFSDDDIIETNAVQVFYESMDEESLLYKFHTKIIDEKGDLNPYYVKFDQLNNLEDYISSDDFINNRLKSNGFRSFAVEYIFHRSLFLSIGFIDFPLAWNSDDACWLRYSIANGKRIKLLNSYVYWRLSTSNITSDTKSSIVTKQKVDASILYLEWLNKMLIDHNLLIHEGMLLKWFSIQIGVFMPYITMNEFCILLKKLPYSFKRISISIYFLRYVRSQGIKRKFQVVLKLNR